MDWVKGVKDSTKRFRLRPRYVRSELNSMAAEVAPSFLERKYGCIRFPLRTEDLKILIERSVEDLDLYYEFSEEEGNAEGVTIFSPGNRPSIKIARRLTLWDTLHDRLRFTLAHEYGHVLLHTQCYERGGNLRYPHTESAYRSAPQVNWMESDASYFGSALLMPKDPVLQAMEEIYRNPAMVPRAVGNLAERLIDLMSTRFGLSTLAACVRFKQLFRFSDLTELTKTAREFVRIVAKHQCWYGPGIRGSYLNRAPSGSYISLKSDGSAPMTPG
jgi:hypothetical protein